MNIWLINHYAVPPKYYPLARQTYFAKHLMALGHTVTIFAASTVHNSDKNLITGKERWRQETVDGVHYVYIKCLDYQGNGLRRIYNICEFAWKLPGVCKKFPRPDAIVATSVPPTSCAIGVYLARKYKCRGVAEIADLWPEGIVVNGIAGPYNPAVVGLRWLERWIYQKADAVVFTMEGGYDYIIRQGWDRKIPRSKVFHINNGVDLELFDRNRELYPFTDPDLSDPDIVKVVYTGSIRLANEMGTVVDMAEALAGSRIRFLIWGAGDDVEPLRRRVRDRGLTNIIFKGRVEKKYIPSIVSQADITLVHWGMNSLLQYGISYNKLFEYLAAGRPVYSTVRTPYSIIKPNDCGAAAEGDTPAELAAGLLRLADRPREELLRMGQNARRTAEQYDFKVLTDRLLAVIEGRCDPVKPRP